MATVEKISVSVPIEDLEWAREQAEESATSLSVVVSEALRRARQSSARRRLLAELGTGDITEEERVAVEAEWR